MKESPSEDHKGQLAAAGPGPSGRRRHLGWVVLAVAVAGAVFVYWYNHRAGAALPRTHGGGHHGFGGGGPGGIMPVVATPVVKGRLDIYLNGLGTVTPLADVTVRTQISGQLVKVAFAEGQEVKKGDLLALIDPRPYQVAQEQAEGQLTQAQFQLQQAKGDLARYIQLAKEDSIAQQQVDDQQALVGQYQGLCRADQATIDSAKLNLTYCQITAPVAGRVGLRQVDPGNYVTPTDANGIVVLTQLDPISVIFTLPEDNIDEVAERIHSGEPVPVDAYDRTMTRKIASGTLETIDNEVDTTTGTVRLRAIFANGDGRLFANQFVNVRMLLNVEPDAIIVPGSSIERGEDGTFVYVVKADDTVTARPVVLGPSEGELQGVISGVAVGDRVVSDGADKLKEGMPVVVQAPAGAGGHHHGSGKRPGGGSWQKKPAGGTDSSN